MIPPAAEPNLLFGVLALNAQAIDPQKLEHACRLWAVRRRAPLAEILEERSWISAECRRELEDSLRHKLAQHSGDSRAALDAALDDRVRQVLTGIPHPAIRQALAPRSAVTPLPARSNGLVSPRSSALRKPFSFRRALPWRAILPVAVPVFLALLLGTALWMLWAERRGRSQAETDLSDTLDALDVQVRSFAEVPPGRRERLMPMRESLLRSAHEAYESLTHTPGEGRAARLVRGRATAGLAAVTLGLGDPPNEAVDLAQRATGLLQPLADQHPQEARCQAAVADALLLLARASAADGRREVALAAYGAAGHSYAGLLRRYPDAPQYRRPLAIALVGFGEEARLRWNYGRAQPAYERARDLLKKLDAEHPGMPEFQHLLAVALRGLVSAYGNTGQGPPSRLALTEAIPIAGGLARNYPGVPAYQYVWGRVLWAAGVLDVNRAEASMDKAGGAWAQALVQRIFVLDAAGATVITPAAYAQAARLQAARAEMELRRGLGVANALAASDLRAPDYPELAGQIRVCIAQCRALVGDHRRARAELDGVLATRPQEGILLFNAFYASALCASAVAADGTVPREQRASLQDALRAQAVDLLRRTQATGYPVRLDFLVDDPNVRPLSTRDDFKKLREPHGAPP